MEQEQKNLKPYSQQPTPLVIKYNQNYFTKLFSGRLNRQNYILGSTFFVIVPTICFLIVIFNILRSPNLFAMPYLDPTSPSGIATPQISLISLLTTPANAFWSLLGILFIILSLPYLLSLQIRRLHDINLSGWFWIVNFGSLLPLYSMFSSGIEAPKPTLFFWISEFVGLAASIFSFYISFWPGTNGPNHYGEKPPARSSLLSDILQLK